MDSKFSTEKRCGWPVVALAVFLLLAGYVMSVGPIGRYVNYATWNRIYFPLVTISDRSDPAFTLLAHYMVWWGAWKKMPGCNGHPIFIVQQPYQ